MFRERGFSEQEVVRDRQGVEEQQANDPGHIAQVAAHQEQRERHKRERRQRNRRVWSTLRRLFGRSSTRLGP